MKTTALGAEMLSLALRSTSGALLWHC